MTKDAKTGKQAHEGFSRRGFLKTGAVGTGAAALSGRAAAQAEGPMREMQVELTVNGRPYALTLDARTTLLDALREHVGLSGTKVGCNHGQCGACTVLLDGTRVNSCLTLAAMASGREVTTVEGLASEDGTLHPMQAAFIENDAFQCGYCTPGQIVSAVACVKEGHATDDAEIREYMSGNICRCAAYKGIVAAVKQAKPQIEGDA